MRSVNDPRQTKRLGRRLILPCCVADNKQTSPWEPGYHGEGGHHEERYASQSVVISARRYSSLLVFSSSFRPCARQASRQSLRRARAARRVSPAWTSELCR